MNKQRGYWNIGPTLGDIVGIVIIIFLLSGVFWVGFPWLWTNYIGPFLHGVTAP